MPVDAKVIITQSKIASWNSIFDEDWKGRRGHYSYICPMFHKGSHAHCEDSPRPLARCALCDLRDVVEDFEDFSEEIWDAGVIFYG